MPFAPLNSHTAAPRASGRHQGFTMVEILVAIGVFFLLLTVILIPIRLAFDSLNIGRARSEVQQAAQVTVSQIEQDLKKAVYVFPNAYLDGVTTTAPFKSPNYLPYVKSKNTAAKDTVLGPCEVGTTAEYWSNVARIDMILPVTSAGSVTLPVRAGDSVVTYYARRLIMDPANTWDPNDNPIVLFRAQFPYRKPDGTDFFDSGSIKNADIGKTRFYTSCGGSAVQNDRQSLWLSHNFYGEANLESLCDTDATDSSGATAFASHSQVTPRGIAMVASHAMDATTPSYVPDSSFTCEDSDGNGTVDRVTVNLMLANYSAANAVSANAGSNSGQLQGQIARITRTVDCPNIR